MFVIDCIKAKFCKKICVGKLSPRSTQCTRMESPDEKKWLKRRKWKDRTKTEKNNGDNNKDDAHVTPLLGNSPACTPLHRS